MAMSIRRCAPPYFKSNIVPIGVGIKGQTLYWTPRYILVYQGRNVGLVRYRDLQATLDTTRFIEDGAAPRDARVVDTTWRYVNKKGGPDRRFSNNRELPVCLYGEVTLKSKRGLHVELMLSRTDAADGLPGAIDALVKQRAASREPTSPSPAIPESIMFCCHSCGKRFRVRLELRGKAARCKACGASLIIPRPDLQTT
jgi:hypothetical protein